MKFINNARNGAIISTVIVVIALVIILMIGIIPTNEPNTLNSQDKLMSYVNSSVNKEETPMWKTVCYIILAGLVILEIIVNFVMCRCHNCGRHIWNMNIFMMYCPYCSKSLDTPKDR